MKKKLLFMLINMNVGGTEKALLNMISEIPLEKYDITLLMLEEYGGFLNSIPSGVKIEFVQGYNEIKEIINKPPHLLALSLFKKGKMLDAIFIGILHLITKISRERSLFYKYILWDYPINKTQYDVAIAYAGPMDFISYFVIYKIKARKKIQWIHFDITKIGFNQRFAEKIYKRFDKIFVVSEEGREKVINLLPILKGKIDKFINIISSNLVMDMANNEPGFEDDFRGVRILTVGRLSHEKGQDLTVPVLARLKKEGYNVKWYCIGEGSVRKEYEMLIREYNLENDYKLLGAKTNPYPYMKQCDIYVQPSRFEGYCITLAEARCFNKPIVSTNFTGANEQISNEETGLIVNFDELKMYEAIKKLLDDNYLRNRFSRNLENEIVDSTFEMEKLFEIVDKINV